MSLVRTLNQKYNISADLFFLRLHETPHLDAKKLEGYTPYLKAIDKAIDDLDKYDRDGGYGDMAQNFENAERERITKRLYALIKKDLKK
jgi:hypothetical protein